MSAASEISQTRDRRAMRRSLSADRSYPRIVFMTSVFSATTADLHIDDLPSVDGIEPVGDPPGMRQVRFGDQDRDVQLLDLLDRVDEPVTTTGASPSKGSSRRRTLGESIMARAMATIFF